MAMQYATLLSILLATVAVAAPAELNEERQSATAVILPRPKPGVPSSIQNLKVV